MVTVITLKGPDESAGDGNWMAFFVIAAQYSDASCIDKEKLAPRNARVATPQPDMQPLSVFQKGS
ncbi:hypothetical protein NEUTE2DRAFT_125467 [Neurospora tetrasperma FGSC 2509]|nr:hypothetical protein NEUTE2DRAFT_125467 [Neurospora tetrasperma FGSC 2509]